VGEAGGLYREPDVKREMSWTGEASETSEKRERAETRFA
jgi:hypothetical protein